MRYLIIIVLLLNISLYKPAFSASITYTYDEMDRLHEVILENGQHILYDYDKIGNILSKAISGNNTTIPGKTENAFDLTPILMLLLND